MKLVSIGQFLLSHFVVCEVLKWFVSHVPYLVHENSIAPHITSSGVLLVVESLNQIIIVMGYMTSRINI